MVGRMKGVFSGDNTRMACLNVKFYDVVSSA